MDYSCHRCITEIDHVMSLSENKKVINSARRYSISISDAL
jgi:hypothetical protein